MPLAMTIDVRSLPRWRWAVQGLYAALTALIAWEFVSFFRQVVAGGPVTAARPAGVEAYLPLGSLIGLRRWAETGYWDEIHPAGLTVLLAAIGGAVLARRAFCSWICPVGTFSRALEWFRARVLRLPPRWDAPRWLRRIAAGAKYALLAQILWSFARLPLEGVQGFMYLPYNLAADANMLLYVANVSARGAVVLGGLVVLSVVVRNAWCRFLCPYGALLGVAGALSPLRVVRDEGACRDCRACTRACGAGIRVHEARAVHGLECTSCMACVAACRVDGALGVRSPRGRRAPPWVVPALAVGVLVSAWLIARATGFWETSLTVDDFRWAYDVGLRRR